MFSWLSEGGAFMYIILGVSVIAFAVILERLWSLTLTYTWDPKFFRGIIQFTKAKDFGTAQRMCLETTHPLGKVLLPILKGRGEVRENLESSAQVSMQKVFPKITKGTGLLQMFGNVATLLGLLGTIQGLTVAFSSLGGASGAEKAELLANGISTAMNTTAFGLVVAIPCLVAFTLLSNRENQILDKYEALVEELVHVMSLQAVPTIEVSGASTYSTQDLETTASAIRGGL